LQVENKMEFDFFDDGVFEGDYLSPFDFYLDDEKNTAKESDYYLPDEFITKEIIDGWISDKTNFDNSGKFYAYDCKKERLLDVEPFNGTVEQLYKKHGNVSSYIVSWRPHYCKDRSLLVYVLNHFGDSVCDLKNKGYWSEEPLWEINWKQTIYLTDGFVSEPTAGEFVYMMNSGQLCFSSNAK